LMRREDVGCSTTKCMDLMVREKDEEEHQFNLSYHVRTAKSGTNFT